MSRVKKNKLPQEGKLAETGQQIWCVESRRD